MRKKTSSAEPALRSSAIKSEARKVLVLHGPNLNLLGTREHGRVLGVGFHYPWRYAINFAQLAPAALGKAFEKDVRHGFVERAKVGRFAKLQ